MSGYRDVYFNAGGVKPGVYRASDLMHVPDVLRSVPGNRADWYAVDVAADGSARIYKDRNGLSAHSSPASLADAGAKVIDIGSMAAARPRAVAEEVDLGTAPMVGAELKERVSGAPKPGRTVDIDVPAVDIDSKVSMYAKLSFAELRATAKGRGLNGSGGRLDLIDRLVLADADAL